MLNNCTYDKIKILNKLSCLSWFIEKHGLSDAQKNNDQACENEMKVLQANLQKHIAIFEDLICKK